MSLSIELDFGYPVIRSGMIFRDFHVYSLEKHMFQWTKRNEMVGRNVRGSMK